MVDEVAEEDEGPVHHPNFKDEGDSLYCFLDKDRPCSAECTAYMSKEADAPVDPQQRRCLILVSVERLPRYIGGAVSIMKKEHEAMVAARGDQRRSSYASPPDPMGKKP